jgi:signal transduction histidine kinase
MAIIVEQQHLPPPPPRPDRPLPWSPRAWRQALFVAAAIPALVVPAFPILLIAVAFAKVKAGSGNPLPLLLALLPLALLLPALTRIHRHRLRATAGVVIPPPRVGRWRPTPPAIAAGMRSPQSWRRASYHLVAAPALAAASLGAVGSWLVGIAFASVYLYAWALPPTSRLHRGLQLDPSQSHLPRILGLQADIWLTLAGLACLAVAPRLTRGVQALDARAGLALLGPSRAEELQRRVEELAQTRAGAVDAADAERRRLERDLHDGTQQRLVSLAINLGMARAQASTAEEARRAIAEAHEEAKSALAELRDLIRGLHPAVLEDRGLDAALSGVAARMPIPVRLTVDLPRRPAPVIEAVAYFVVSEGLANIVKHAQASQAEVVVSRAGDRLHIIVSDDGAGGADPARGTGLTGLAKRAASVDGTFEIVSPPGGPTLLTVDLPCAR